MRKPFRLREYSDPSRPTLNFIVTFRENGRRKRKFFTTKRDAKNFDATALWRFKTKGGRARSFLHGSASWPMNATRTWSRTPVGFAHSILGIPICDRFEELGWNVRRVNNGSPAREPEIYGNLAAEIWVQGARKIERGEIILPNDPELFAQLTTRRIGANSRGQIVLESKEQMRARGLRSPDRADAVLGCLYERKRERLLFA